MIGIVSDAKDNGGAPAPGWQHFDIELDGRKMVCRHQTGTNQYVSAQKFIDENELEQDHLDEVADFIEKNGAAPTLTFANAEPVNMDPLTGAGGWRPSAAAPVAAAPASPFPVTACVTFKAVKTAGLLKKIHEFNAVVPEAQRLVPAESDALAAGVGALQKCDAGVIAPIVLKMLGWPAAQIFPAVDVLRLCLAEPHLQAALLADGSTLEFCLKTAGLAGPAELSGPAEMLAMRCLANALSVLPRSAVPEATVSGIVAALDGARLGQMNKNTLLAATTILLNLAVGAARADAGGGAGSLRDGCLAGAQTLIAMESCQNDPETAYRALLALGTLVATRVGSGAVRAAVAADAIEPLTCSSDARVKSTATAVLKLIRAAPAAAAATAAGDDGDDDDIYD